MRCDYDVCRPIAAVFCVCFILMAGPRGPNYDDIRTMGMGNTSVAVTTDRTAIFHNPAGLGLLKDKLELSFTPIILSIDGNLLSLFKALWEQSPKLQNIDQIDDEFITTLNEYDGEWVGVQYIPEVTIAKKNIGFGVYTVWPAGMRIESGHFIPKLALRGERDLVFTWAVGVPLKSKNHSFGISLEYVQRTPVEETITTYSETFILADDLKSRPLGVLGDFANVQHGASFDIGFMHDFFPGFRLAWDVKDVFGVIGGEIIFPFQLDIGCAYYFPELEKYSWIRSFILACEFSDLFKFEPKTEKYEQFAKKIHLGGEFDLKYIALRGGFNQGYPTFGVGIDLQTVKFDYVFFTQELGYFVGQLPNKKHIFSMSIGLRIGNQGKGTDADVGDGGENPNR